MDELLRYYEEELGLFGQFAREFRARYPKPAGELHVAGEAWDDPGVARLIQSVALLSARINKRLDDDYPKFTEALLDSLYPHYLRPLPSHSVVQVGYRTSAEVPDHPVVLPRGTVLRSSAAGDVPCLFRTAYDVLLAPLKVARLAFVPAGDAPRGAACGIRLTIEATRPDAAFERLPSALRLFADGEASLRAAFIDALFLRTTAAWLQPHGDTTWLPLAKVPLRLAGFASDDALLPGSMRSHPAPRLLTEYFCYPEKFHFIDVDLAALRDLLPPRCRGFTLHLALSGIAPDADGARLLAGLDACNLLPGCTPVVNLFPKAGAPLQLAYTSADYPLLADGAHAKAYEIHSVDAVRLVREATGDVTPFAPLYAPAGAGRADAAHYWIARRDYATARSSPGHEMRIALVDADFRPLDAAGATLSTELTCTNRDLPARLPYGQPQGDLRSDAVPGLAPVRMLRKPSPGWRFTTARGTHWRLIAHLALNHAGLTMAGLTDFHKMLALYDLPRSPVAQRQIAGLVGLEHGAVRAWVGAAPVATLTPGIGIRLTIDEDAFAGTGLYPFACVLDYYFALHGQLNCFTRLQIVSQQTGRELLAFAPRGSGDLPDGGWT